MPKGIPSVTVSRQKIRGAWRYVVTFLVNKVRQRRYFDTRKAYPSDVGDEEWSFCAPYLTLMDEKAPERIYPLREISTRCATS
jgi:hypothetical protein